MADPYNNRFGYQQCSPSFPQTIPGFNPRTTQTVHGFNPGIPQTGFAFNSPQPWQWQHRQQQQYSGVSSPSSSYVNNVNATAAHSRQRGSGDVIARADIIARAEHAATAAYTGFLSAGESVTVWELTQSVLSTLKADSLESLGLRVQDIPCLYKIILLEGKLNAFVHCYVAVRRIATLHDLSTEICRQEGVEDFERLGLGPLIRHPLIVHYFAPPADILTAFKITTEQIISYLSDFLDDWQEKDIRVEEFLSFVSKKESVSFPAQLCIRIQSLRMHIGFLWRTKKVEKDLNRQVEAETEKKIDIERRKQISAMQSKIISERLGSFLSSNKETTSSGHKHIRFETVSSSDNDEDPAARNTSVRSVPKKKLDHQCEKSGGRCPYPSAAEELARLGKQPSTDKERNCLNSFSDEDEDPGGKSQDMCRRKRRKVLQHEKSLVSRPFHSTAEEHVMLGKQVSTEKSKYAKDDVLLLKDNELKIFIAAWKDICREQSVYEVFTRMLELQWMANKKGNKKCTRKLFKLFTMQPAIGLLNVAVMSMKMGLWDSLYDTFQEVNKQDGRNTETAYVSGVIDVGISKAAAPVPSVKEEGDTLVSANGVSIGEVLQQVISFLERDSIEIIEAGELAMKEWFMTLRRIWDCEKWLMKQFSIRDFTVLGFGDFLDFLKDHISQFPDKIIKKLVVHNRENLSLTASIAKNQLLEFLSQATSENGENVLLTREEVNILLYKQFPSIRFELPDSYSFDEVLNYIRKLQNYSEQKKTRYSAALLARNSTSDHSSPSSAINEKWISEAVQIAGAFGHMTSADALKCLLKAPMLSDLEEWSHWDHIFAPTLGPILNWLDKEGNVNSLLCLVLRSGKVVRIDGSATMEGFLTAAVKCSAKKTAAQLVSIVSLYGGTRHAPVALMKSHACRAIDIMVKNCVDCFDSTTFMALDKTESCINSKRSQQREMNADGVSSHSSVLGKAHVVHDYNETAQKVERTNQAIRVAARFILDCLVCIPSEFRTFASHIFFSGLTALEADVSQVLLQECVAYDERVMLHEIGLSIGIVDWINDYQFFSLDAEHSSMSEECLDSKSTVQNDGQFDTKSNYGAHQLEGIHCPDFKRKEASLDELQSEHLDDQNVSQDMPKDCDNHMARSQALAIDRLMQVSEKGSQDEDGRRIIEAIRRDEFGLDLELECNESLLLKKQHARLSRALLCLSQELYSQDSHFLLELVQNADDNAYPANVEPTLAFILQTTGVMVLNNELGFTAENIRALCDVGNSTKKGSNAGYIGQKGIGFKSVFRVTDSPEIHSNGFHIKFDITEGELGFILPTPVPPLCNLELFSRDLASGNENLDCLVWNTCIVLPFKCSLVEGTGMRSWASKFADFHPSLLLFLHRLRCIKVRDSMTNSLTIMRREDIGNGLVKVSHGKESTTWLVASHKLDAGTMRPGIQSTEIAMAFTLRQDSSGEFVPYLEQQPVFAFLPLRAYGLKFILQGDFILPSSREEVDGDSAWNQWLLSEFPGLFVNAAESFRSLPCYQSNPGKAVSLYMSFVPLVGEVLGFFSPLPRMILSKLRVSPCLPLEGKDKRWVLPCMVLRGWNDQIRTLLPDDLLSSHLGVGYLHRDVSLSDPIAAALGVHTFGPRILIDLMKSVCNRGDDLKNLGSNWIGSWLVTLYECLNCRLTGYESCFQVNSESDFLNDLAQIPFIPLSDGSYTSIREDSIWLPCEATRSGVDGAHILKNFPKLYCELRTVHPSLFFSLAVGGDVVVRADSDVMVCMLRRAGIGQLSAHEVVMKHILQAMTNVECLTKDKLILAEYLAFIMVHLQSNCSLCHLERPKMIQELQVKAVIITNNGYRRAGSEPLHFSREFGNPVDMKKVLAGTNVVWNEIDSVYLQFASNEVRSLNMLQWRKFFTELGVTDLMQVVNIEKKLEDQSCSIWKDLAWEGNANSVGWTVNDWESPELVDILTALSSSSTYVDQCSHFLQVLDSVWDDLYGAKKATYCCGSPGVKEGKCTESSCVLKIREYCWVKSRLDGKLYIPSNLFFDCDEVRSILGSNAPYATPQVHCRKFVADIGFRTQVLVKDALSLLSEWSKSECMFKASTSQMGRLYSFLSTRMDTCRDEIVTHFRLNPSIFVPLMDDSNQESVTPGMFLLLDQVYWRDPTGCLDLLIKGTGSSTKIPVIDQMCCRALCEIYPNLHSFFVNDCLVQTSPDFDGYLRILKHLASIALPSKVYEEVMQVFYLWAEDIESQRVNCKEISRWKDSLHDSGNSVLPTMQDKWVSLHPKFGIVCWYDDADLSKQFEHCNGVHFLCIDAGGKHNKTKAKDGVQSKLITFIRAMGIPSLSEVVVREAIFYGVQDNKKLLSLINWILPYAQRYLYSMHPEVYCALKDNIFNDQLNQLRFLVVEELFYRHTLQGCHTVSNERHGCTCLLQGSTLYVSRMADFSGIYSELSRLFFNGCVDLQLANFLHLITIMAESGSTEEQTESFILNAQTIPKLPLEELTWFCEHRGDEIDNHSKLSNPTFPENKLTTKKLQKISADASWPPTTWKGVPKSRDGVLAQAGNSGINQDFVRHEHNNVIGNSTVSKTNNACESDQVTDTYSGSAVTTIPYDSKSEQDMDTKRVKFGGDSDLTGNDNNFLGLSTTGLESADVSDKSYKLFAPNEMDMGTCNVFSNRNQLCLGVADDEQRQVTGRLGERVVYKYLSDKYGPTSVNWVNENGETGSAFDMVVSKEDGKKEFIEVKATRSENKDWFEITNREWDFASKNSDCFTIIRVFLGSSPYVKFVMLANPIKLYQQKIIKLAILMPINKNCALPEVTFIPQREGGD